MKEGAKPAENLMKALAVYSPAVELCKLNSANALYTYTKCWTSPASRQRHFLNLIGSRLFLDGTNCTTSSAIEVREETLIVKRRGLGRLVNSLLTKYCLSADLYISNQDFRRTMRAQPCQTRDLSSTDKFSLLFFVSVPQFVYGWVTWFCNLSLLPRSHIRPARASLSFTSISLNLSWNEDSSPKARQSLFIYVVSQSLMSWPFMKQIVGLWLGQWW